MKRKKCIQDCFDSVSGQIAAAMRSTFAKYKSLTENLREVQRGMESAKTTCQVLYRTIDGPCWEILLTDPKYRTDGFIQNLYDAMTNVSIRKWAREHVKLVKDMKDQLEGVSRKADKLKERFDADPHSEEAKATAILLKRMVDTRLALEHRIEFTVRKFLELRLCVLKTLIGTSETMFNAAEGILSKEMLEQFVAPTKKACEEISWADERATRSGRRSK